MEGFAEYSQYIGYALDALVVAFVVLFAFLGFIKGRRKALKGLIINCIIIAIAFFGSIALTEFAKTMPLTINGQEYSIANASEIIQERSEDFSDKLPELIGKALDENPEALEMIIGFLLSFSRVFIFLVLLLVLFLLKFILGILLFPIKVLFFRRKKKGSKKRIFGAGVGAVNGFVVSLAILMPIVGLNHTIQEVAKVETLNNQYNIADYDLFSNSYLSKYIGEAPIKVYDYLTSFKVNGKTYYVRSEMEALISVYAKFEKLGFGTEGFDMLKLPDNEVDDFIDGVVDIFKDLNKSDMVKSLLPVGVAIGCGFMTVDGVSCDDIELDKIDFENLDLEKEATSIGNALRVVLKAPKVNEQIGIKSFNATNVGELFYFLGQSEIFKVMLPVIIEVGITKFADQMILFDKSISELFNIQEITSFLSQPNIDFAKEGRGLGALLEIVSVLMENDESGEVTPAETSIELTDEVAAELKQKVKDNKENIDGSKLVNIIFPGVIVMLINSALSDMNIENIDFTDEELAKVILSNELLGMLSLLELSGLLDSFNGDDLILLINNLKQSEAILIKKVISKVIEVQSKQILDAEVIQDLGIDLGELLFEEPETVAALVDLSNEITQLTDFNNVTSENITDLFDKLQNVNESSESLSKILPTLIEQQKPGSTDGIDFTNVDYSEEGKKLADVVDIAKKDSSERTTEEVTNIADNLVNSTVAISALTSTDSKIEVSETEYDAIIADFTSKGYIGGESENKNAQALLDMLIKK